MKIVLVDYREAFYFYGGVLCVEKSRSVYVKLRLGGLKRFSWLEYNTK